MPKMTKGDRVIEVEAGPMVRKLEAVGFKIAGAQPAKAEKAEPVKADDEATTTKRRGRPPKASA